MFKKTLVLVIAVMTLLFACQSDNSNAKENKSEEKKPTNQPIYFTKLAGGIQSGIHESGDYILTNKKSLDSLWALHYSQFSTTPEPPDIDFNKDVVIAVFMGEKKTSGYWIDIDSAYVSGDNMIVVLKMNDKPEPGKPILPVITYPYVIAAVPHLGKEIQFEFINQ